MIFISLKKQFLNAIDKGDPGVLLYNLTSQAIHSTQGKAPLLTKHIYTPTDLLLSNILI